MSGIVGGGLRLRSRPGKKCALLCDRFLTFKSSHSINRPVSGARNPDVPEPRARGRGRPPTVDVDQLLGVARDVFLERGIRATTSEVAERASVSEGSIFHYFKTKEELFRRAMNLEPEQTAAALNDAVSAMEGEDIRDGLEHFATKLLEIGRVTLPLMMMTWSNPEACGGDGQKAAFRGLLFRVIHYFEAQVREGRLRKLDPEVLARCFLGSLHHFTMVRVMAPEAAQMMLPEGLFVRGLVDLILTGASPQPGPSLPAETPSP